MHTSVDGLFFVAVSPKTDKTEPDISQIVYKPDPVAKGLKKQIYFFE